MTKFKATFKNFNGTFKMTKLVSKDKKLQKKTSKVFKELSDKKLDPYFVQSPEAFNMPLKIKSDDGLKVITFKVRTPKDIPSFLNDIFNNEDVLIEERVKGLFTIFLTEILNLNERDVRKMLKGNRNGSVTISNLREITNKLSFPEYIELSDQVNRTMGES